MDIIASIACGFLSGLGIGGGSLLMVYMTAMAQLAQRSAQGINLLYFVPTALLALTFHSKNRFVDWRSSVWAILGGILFAALGAWLSAKVGTDLLRTLFGIFLLFVGITELRTKR